MFIFESTEYSSKADLIRELYKSGRITMKPESKKLWAEKLEITVSTIHATIVKFTDPDYSDKPKKIKPLALIQLEDKIELVKHSKKPIFLNDISDELRSELMNSTYKIAVNFAPNQWGLPVVNPVIYVIDENYDKDWSPTKEDLITKFW